MKLICLITFLVIASLAFASSCPPIDKNKPIDQVVSRSIDVDGDGIPDKIELRLKAKNFNSAFKWELKIYSKNHLIFKRKGNNERIDAFFSDQNYIGDCSGYDDCKCQWYFKKFFDRIASDYKPAMGIQYELAKDALRNEAQLNSSQVEKAIKNAAERIRSGKAVVIRIFDEPEAPTPFLIWMPEFNRIVPIYRP